MTTRRGFMVGGALVAGLFAGGLPALAIGGEARRRIDLAGFQRTRLILIARSACFARAGVNAAEEYAGIGRLTGEFNDIMLALRSGNSELGISRETHDKVLGALRDVQTLWLGYFETAQAAAEAGSMSDDDFARLVEQEPVIYDRMNTAVGTIERSYGGSSLPLHLAVATNLAGRQRSLGQRMAVDACLVGVGYKPEEARARIAETVTLFENTHAALTEGAPLLGIRAPVQPELAALYDTVAERWAAMKALVAPVAGGAPVDADAIAEIGATSDRLLAASDAAVKLYPGES